MSNHSGSYMLNEVITQLNRFQVFQLLGKEKSQELVREIIKVGCKDYDCNAGEIIEDHEALLAMCGYCLQPADDLKRGLCPECRKIL